MRDGHGGGEEREYLKKFSAALKRKIPVSFKALKERGCQICHVGFFCQSWLSNPIVRLTNRAVPCTDSEWENVLKMNDHISMEFTNTNSLELKVQ